MADLSKMKAALKALYDIDINIGRNVGSKANALTNAEIEAAILNRFPNAKITAHNIIPPQLESKFGPFEPTSQVSIKTPNPVFSEALGLLSKDLKQEAIPGINKTTKEAILAGPKAKDWGEIGRAHV